MNKKQQVFNGIVLWLGLAFLSLMLQNFYSVLQYIFFLRVPIIVGLLLLFLPTISVNSGLSAILKNLFVLRANNQLVLVIGGAVLAGLATIQVFDIILYNSHLRFDVPQQQVIPVFLQYLIAIILSLPIGIKATQLSKKEIQEADRSWEGWGIIFGIIAGALLLITNYFNKYFFEHNQFLKQALLKIIYFLPERIQRGYVDANGDLSYGIAAITVFSIFLLIVYGLGYFILKPRQKKGRFEAPALFLP
ncbi:MAG: hypothetical protein RMY64_31040 [Nostoc sp. DedQUE08]|uniref:hypothetical protein n=1 Tax=Nostoc sp. DedQUE08 TaxID=3075393 RepID=UPI002AD2A8FF|nr:hypothetical protein [Nostoc sp. DedQUE08]MDZ8069993.1 hypothetical protein [Nostoc sp. DedQUE08]